MVEKALAGQHGVLIVAERGKRFLNPVGESAFRLTGLSCIPERPKLAVILGKTHIDQLEGGFTESITREGYQVSHDISAYSLAALAKAALPMMEGRDGAILTLTYNAATQVVPNYNVMGLAKASLESCVRFLAADLGPKGIRVNAISAGAVKTLAAAGIGGFRKMLGYAEKASPLRRTVTIEEIGNTAAFLCSDLASGITGETTFVDAGVNIMGMVFDEN